MSKCIKCGVEITNENDSKIPVVAMDGNNKELKICKSCVESMGDDEVEVGSKS